MPVSKNRRKNIRHPSGGPAHKRWSMKRMDRPSIMDVKGRGYQKTDTLFGFVILKDLVKPPEPKERGPHRPHQGARERQRRISQMEEKS